MTGMRVEPPTITTSSIFETSIFASAMACLKGARQRSVRFGRELFELGRASACNPKCLGPSAPAVMNGRLMVVVTTAESSIFAFSAASVRRCMACLSLKGRCLVPYGTRPPATRRCDGRSRHRPNACRRWSTSLRRRRRRLPGFETSNVPPPKSQTRIVSLPFFSRPYASAAAVGSLMMRSTSRPAILPASFVAWRCRRR